jgi:hypothetical protein
MSDDGPRIACDGRTTTTTLSSGRLGRLQLAVIDAFDARDGDPDEYRRRLEAVTALHARLVAEQLAEQGYLPDTLDGMVAVCHVTARIAALVGDLNLIGGDEDAVS